MGKKEEKKINIFEIILTIIKIICVIILILLIAVLALQRFSNNKIAIGGYRAFNVATGSMIPTYQIGDVLIVKEVNPDELKEGDPVSYLGKSGSFAGKIVTHRIIKIEETENGKVFHTKGDNNDAEDPVIKGDQIYGKVIYKCVILSMLTKLMNNLTAFYVIVFIPLGVLIFLQVKDRLDEKREEKQANENVNEENDEEDDDVENDDEDSEEEDEK